MIEASYLYEHKQNVTTQVGLLTVNRLTAYKAQVRLQKQQSF